MTWPWTRSSFTPRCSAPSPRVTGPFHRQNLTPCSASARSAATRIRAAPAGGGGVGSARDRSGVTVHDVGVPPAETQCGVHLDGRGVRFVDVEHHVAEAEAL